MELLTSAGVADAGVALTAATRGRESSVKFFLKRQEWKAGGRGAGYLPTRNQDGRTPMLLIKYSGVLSQNHEECARG